MGRERGEGRESYGEEGVGKVSSQIFGPKALIA